VVFPSSVPTSMLNYSYIGTKRVAEWFGVSLAVGFFVLSTCMIDVNDKPSTLSTLFSFPT
jgi:hypothetical protein